MVSFPISTPSGPGPTNVTLRVVYSIAVGESPYNKIQNVVRRAGGERWVLEADYPVMTEAQAKEWKGWLSQLEGKFGTFMWGDPDHATAQGIATGTPVVNGASQTGATLVTDGWTTSQTGIMKQGDHIQIGNELYMVTEDVNSDGSGNATLPITPWIVTSPSDNATIIVSNPKGIFRMESNDNSVSTDSMRYGTFSIRAVQAK